jgi:hypothetical protein
MSSTIGIQNLIQALGRGRATFVAHVGAGATTTTIPLVDLNLGGTNLAGNLVLLDAGALGPGSQPTVATISSNTATSLTVPALSTAPVQGATVWIFAVAAVQANISENIAQVGGRTLPVGQTAPDLPVMIDGATVQAPVDVQSALTQQLDSTVSPLAANASYVGAWNAVGLYRSLFATVYADQVGQLVIDQSPDGTNADYTLSTLIAPAATSQPLVIPVKAAYARLRVINGPTAQTTLRAYLWASPLGAVVERLGRVVLALASASYTTSSQSATLTVGGLSELAVDVNVTALSGTSVQFYVDRLGALGNWFNIWQSSALTASGTASTSIGSGLATNQSFGAAVRLRWALTGTSVTFSASIIGK